jgi:hypothetical protein
VLQIIKIRREAKYTHRKRSKTRSGSLFQLPVTIGFAVTIGLTPWLFISILAGTR